MSVFNNVSQILDPCLLQHNNMYAFIHGEIILHVHVLLSDVLATSTFSE